MKTRSCWPSIVLAAGRLTGFPEYTMPASSSEVEICSTNAVALSRPANANVGLRDLTVYALSAVGRTGTAIGRMEPKVFVNVSEL